MPSHLNDMAFFNDSISEDKNVVKKRSTGSPREPWKKPRTRLRRLGSPLVLLRILYRRNMPLVKQRDSSAMPQNDSVGEYQNDRCGVEVIMTDAGWRSERQAWGRP